MAAFAAQDVKSRARVERAAAKRRKELNALAKSQAAWEDRQRAEYEVGVYENTIEFLLSMHKDCGPEWNWPEVVARQPPPPPQRGAHFETQARAAIAASLGPAPQRGNQYERQAQSEMLAGLGAPPQPSRAFENEARAMASRYQPSLADKLLGADVKRRAELQNAIAQAQQRDAHAFAAAQAHYAQLQEHYRWKLAEAQRWDEQAFGAAQAEYAQRQEHFRAKLVEAQQRDTRDYQTAQQDHAWQVERHSWERTVGTAILAGDLAAYRAAIDHLSPFAELVESGMSVSLEVLRHDVAVFRCAVRDDSVVPREEKKQTANGKLSSKALAAGRYWEIYQDYVCGCALRVAREVFALAPLPRVVVNAAISGVDSSTGHNVYRTILAVSIPREVALELRFGALDPSDSLKNFPHRMKFKKSSGFDAVEPISADESFITTVGGRG